MSCCSHALDINRYSRQGQSKPVIKHTQSNIILVIGTATRVLQMVHCLICHLHSWGPRLCPCNLWLTISIRWPSNCSMVLVDRFLHGHVHRKLGSRVSLRLSDSRRNVLRHQTCGAARPGPDLLLGSGLVQSIGSNSRGVQCGIYRQSDAAGLCQHELGFG